MRVVKSGELGIPLQQAWSYNESGDFAPTYYLEADAPLYYYSFVDAAIAMVKAEGRLTPRAIIPVDLFGLAADYDVRAKRAAIPRLGRVACHRDLLGVSRWSTRRRPGRGRRR